MKKIIAIALILMLLLTTAACNKNTDNDKLKIVTTIFPYYSFAKEICGDDADIAMLIKPGAESHTFDPTTKDILTIQNSDVFIYTGGESEKWVESILSAVDTSKTKVIKAIDFVEEAETHNHKKDEHIWTSPKNAIKITQEIYKTINNSKYSESKDRFISELELLDKEFENILSEPYKTVIFADRFPFLYLAKDYNMKYLSAFPSCSEESEPGIQTITEIINTVKKEGTNGIFYIEFSNQKIADTIQNETGAKKLLFHSCHNISNEEFEDGATYLTLMKQNLINLTEAIK